MDNVLDNPIWNGLISNNKHLSLGNEYIKYFPIEIAPFAGLKEVNNVSLRLLYDIAPEDRVFVLITAAELAVPKEWKIIRQETILQMVFDVSKPINIDETCIVPLEKKDVPQMLSLTQLTNPGPFLERTIEFGFYSGIFKEGQLVAMAGQRMHPDGYAEISAVCTHPGFTGNGFGSRLLSYQAGRITRQGEIPFLHVRGNNENAIKIYKSLGFSIRKNMHLRVIQKIID